MMLANKRVEELQPWMQYAYKQLVIKCKKAGFDILLIETKRSQERQDDIYKDGTGPKELGPHGFGCAFDTAPLTNSKLDWANIALFKKMGEIGKRLGLAWGGDWKKFDCPHFEYRGGLTDAELRAGKLPKFPKIPIEQEGFKLMDYKLQPICQGMLLNTGSLTCYTKPSKNNKTTNVLRKGIHEPIKIYAKVYNEGIYWYLVNAVNEQWVEAAYVKII